MKYLLDTCLISELIKNRPNSNVVKWISSVEEDDLYISVLTIGELTKGIEKLKVSKKKRELKDWFLELKKRFEKRTLPISRNISELWGATQANLEATGVTLSSIDSLIACTAIDGGFVVVTRNVRDIEPAGARVLNPWA